MPKEVALEVVTYNLKDIAHATAQLVQHFAAHSGIPETEAWMRPLVGLLDVIHNQKNQEFGLTAEGLDIIFSGFKLPRPTLVNGSVVFIAPEPYFTLEDRLQGLLPSQRTHVLQVVEAIGQEMSEVYGMKFTHDPVQLIFPTEKYGERHITKALMLDR